MARILIACSIANLACICVCGALLWLYPATRDSPLLHRRGRTISPVDRCWAQWCCAFLTLRSLSSSPGHGCEGWVDCHLALHWEHPAQSALPQINTAPHQNSKDDRKHLLERGCAGSHLH